MRSLVSPSLLVGCSRMGKRTERKREREKAKKKKKQVT